MSKTRVGKTKGKNGQNEIKDLILKYFPELEPDDVISNPMGNMGEDIMLSPKARKLMPFNIEVKRRKAFSMSVYMKQAEHHGNHKPLLFFRQDRDIWYTTMKTEDFFEMLKR